MKIKSSRASEGNNEAIKHTLPIKNIDLSGKRLNIQHVSDYPLVIARVQYTVIMKFLVLVGDRLAHKLGTGMITVFNIKTLTEPVGGFYTNPVFIAT